MPVSLVDPTIQATGAGIPNGPLANMMGQALGAYGRAFPSALDRSTIDYHNAEIAKLQQQQGASQQLGDIFRSAMNPQAIPAGAPVEGPRPTPDAVGPEPAVQPMAVPKPEDIIRQNLPNLVAAMQAGGHVENTPQLARMMSAYIPGAAQNVKDTPVGTPSNMDLAMLGSGESYESTPGGFREKNQAGFTSEQKNITAKSAQLQSMYGLSPQDAYSLATGIAKTQVDPVNGQMYLVNEAAGTRKLMTDASKGGAAPAATGIAETQPDFSAPPVPVKPVAVGSPVNNPGNLRPVGSDTGFNQYASMADGVNALKSDLLAKLTGQSKAMAGKEPTLRNIITTYSPATENNTPALLQNAAIRMGVDPDAPLGPQHLGALTAAIVQQEGHGTKSGAPAAAPVAPPKFSPNNLNFDLNNAFGVGNTLSRVMSGNGGTAGDTLSQLNGLKGAMVDVDSALRNGRNTQFAQELSADQLPFSEKDILSPTDLAKTGWQDGNQGNTDIARKLNDYIQVRADMTKRLADQNNPLPKDEEVSMSRVLPMIDRMVNLYTTGPERDQYNKSFNVDPSSFATAPTAPIAAPAPPTNLEAGKALTNPSAYKSTADVVAAAKAGTLTRAQAKQILNSQFGIQ